MRPRVKNTRVELKPIVAEFLRHTLEQPLFVYPLNGAEALEFVGWARTALQPTPSTL